MNYWRSSPVSYSVSCKLLTCHYCTRAYIQVFEFSNIGLAFRQFYWTLATWFQSIHGCLLLGSVTLCSNHWHQKMPVVCICVRLPVSMRTTVMIFPAVINNISSVVSATLSETHPSMTTMRRTIYMSKNSKCFQQNVRETCIINSHPIKDLRMLNRPALI